jgi:AcrR family transcriptional regulator
MMPMTNPDTTSGRKNDPAGMRDGILYAAALLFTTLGYEHTSTQDILRTAGVSSGALHHHFPVKKGLGLAVIWERVDRAVEETWILPMEKATSIMAAIEIIDLIAAGLRRRGEVRGCPLSNLAVELAYVDPDFRAPANAIFSKWRLALTARIRADQCAGWRCDLDAAACANLIVAAFSGAMAMAKVEQSERPLVSTSQMLSKLLD